MPVIEIYHGTCSKNSKSVLRSLNKLKIVENTNVYG
jgi:hypothetical protein